MGYNNVIFFIIIWVVQCSKEGVEMIQKIVKRIFMWHNRLLTFGGKWILINNVLQSMLVSMLPALNLPMKFLDQIHQIFAKCFWGNFGGIEGKHWVALEELWYPKAEGGVGFWSLHDVNKDLFAKLLMKILNSHNIIMVRMHVQQIL